MSIYVLQCLSFKEFVVFNHFSLLDFATLKNYKTISILILKIIRYGINIIDSNGFFLPNNTRACVLAIVLICSTCVDIDH